MPAARRCRVSTPSRPQVRMLGTRERRNRVLGRRSMTIAGLESIRNTEHWVEDSLCSQVDVGDVFFVPKGGSTKPAKMICAACPVATQCLQYAIDHDERFGIWGGFSERERRALRRDTPRDTSLCANGHVRAEVGVTNSGYCRQCQRDRYARYGTRVREGRVAATVVVHGCRTRYQLGCHCVLCVAANSEYMRKHRGRPLTLTPGAGR
jgi:WhiB family redox-sensing transcriptional regulator